MPRPLLTTLVLLLSLSSPAAAQDTPDTEWAQLLANDARVKFTPRTELAALTVLEGGGLDNEGRAAAVFALGASGSTRERAFLEGTLVNGTLQERCAAVLALGEMGVGVHDLLQGLREDPAPIVQECALLALMRTGRWAAAEYVEAVAENGDDAHAEMAGRLLLFATNAPMSEATAASRMLLELRWNAAKRFGLVDDQAWDGLLLDQLAGDPVFLKGLLFKAVAEVDRPGVKDHFLAIMSQDRTEPVLRAAVRAMPEEISLLVETGLWIPESRMQWEVLLNEIHERKLEGSTRGLLTAATKEPTMRHRAVALLVRSGQQTALKPILDELDAGELGPGQLLWCCEALANSDDREAIGPLMRLTMDAPLAVIWGARVSLIRLGNSEATDKVRAALNDPSSPDHQLVVSLVSRWAGDPTLAAMLSEALPRLDDTHALRASIALANEGSASGRQRLREVLVSGLPHGDVGARAVDALSRSGTVEDSEFLRLQFPYEEDPVVNEALGLAMIRLRDPIVLPLIRAGIWEGSFDQSVLSSALLVELSGMRALFDELDRVPRGAVDEDLRRIGYALGLWGGVPALRELSSHVILSRDPKLQGALLGALASRTH